MITLLSSTAVFGISLECVNQENPLWKLKINNTKIGIIAPDPDTGKRPVVKNYGKYDHRGRYIYRINFVKVEFFSTSSDRVEVLLTTENRDSNKYEPLVSALVCRDAVKTDIDNWILRNSSPK